MEKSQLVLGIDLGSNSLGWALLKEKEGKPAGIHAMGVRVFDEGLQDRQQDGRGKSRNVARREARLVRRNHERRARRLAKLAHTLQKAGLLPEGNLTDSINRHEFFKALDLTLDNPYDLRAKALDEKLTPHELGRALYHLGQRRGFKSIRKAPMKKDEELGKVKGGIAELGQKMEETGSRTLGEYFTKVNPHEERIRTRYTSRLMYEEEFEKIWEAQKVHHANFTGELKKRIKDAIFKQRPLKSQKNLIGRCELEPERKRAPVALLPAQRFRYLQTLNNLEVEGRKLTEDERKKTIEALETEGDLTFPKARKLLGLPRLSKFNLERGGEKRIPGNRTAAKLREVLGEQWPRFTEKEREKVIEDLRSIVNEDALKKRGMKAWGLDERGAKALSEVPLEDGYIAFSRQAIVKLLPHLEEGKPLQTAIKELYPERFAHEGEPLDNLPPVKSDVFTELRNPLVERSLTELRKVVNAIVEQYGKPEMIRIELARDLRRTADQREYAWKRMRANEKERKKAAEKIVKEAGITNPKRDDILKVLLWEECGWHCPYTGKAISMKALFGEHPQFDIEHIIPFDRSLDDSFLNKTLCDVEENRKRKHNRTPFEAYSGTEKWDEIIGRVKKFKGDAGEEKRDRFLMDDKALEEYLGDFTSRQLNDTRYASRKAKEYLGFLYGGINDDGVDKTGKRRVQATPGGVTAHLRSCWGLNTLLGDGPGKSREDHRHHTVDALVTALTEPGAVKLLSDAARRAQRERRRRFGKVEEPWKGFLEEARKTLAKVVVSPRVSRRVRGKLHAETFYSPRTGQDGKEYVLIRKPLDSLTAKDLENIVDPKVREVVMKHLKKQGGDLKKAFADPKKHPCIETPSGKRYIHRVRIKDNLATFRVGKGHRSRHVVTESNHHMEIVGVLDEKGEVNKWEGHVVSLYEAKKRLRAKEEVVRRDHGDGRKFLFSIANGEIIELDDENKTRRLYVVRTVPQSKQLRIVALNDARMLKVIPKAGLTPVPETLRTKNCQKVVITPLGEVRHAND